jgi:hypothetical protein
VRGHAERKEHGAKRKANEDLFHGFEPITAYANSVLAARGNFGDLRPVPDSNDPNDFPLHPIKKR